MLNLHDSDMGLNSMLISLQMKAFLVARVLGLYAEHDGKFKVSRTYVRMWAKERLAWSFRKPTNNAGKLPTDWESRREALTMKIACLVVGFGILYIDFGG